MIHASQSHTSQDGRGHTTFSRIRSLRVASASVNESANGISCSQEKQSLRDAMYERLGQRLGLQDGREEQASIDHFKVALWMVKWYMDETGEGSRLRKRQILRAAANGVHENAATVARVFQTRKEVVEEALRETDTAAKLYSNRKDAERDAIRQVYYSHAVPSTTLQHYKWCKFKGGDLQVLDIDNGEGSDDDYDLESAVPVVGIERQAQPKRVLVQRFCLEASVKWLHRFYNEQVKSHPELDLDTVGLTLFRSCKPPNFVASDWRSYVCKVCLQMDMYCHALAIFTQTIHRANSKPTTEQHRNKVFSTGYGATQPSQSVCADDHSVCVDHRVRQVFLQAGRSRTPDTKFKLPPLLLCPNSWSKDVWNDKRMDCAKGSCMGCAGQVSAFLPPCPVERERKCSWKEMEQKQNVKGKQETFAVRKEGHGFALITKAKEGLKEWIDHMFDNQWTQDAARQSLQLLKAATLPGPDPSLNAMQLAVIKKTIVFAWDFSMQIELKTQDAPQINFFAPRTVQCLTVEANFVRRGQVEREIFHFIADFAPQDPIFVTLSLFKAVCYVRHRDPALHPREFLIGHCDGAAQHNWSKYVDWAMLKLLPLASLRCIDLIRQKAGHGKGRYDQEHQIVKHLTMEANQLAGAATIGSEFPQISNAESMVKILNDTVGYTQPHKLKATQKFEALCHKAKVLSQQSNRPEVRLPFHIAASQRRAFFLSPDDLKTWRDRCANPQGKNKKGVFKVDFTVGGVPKGQRDMYHKRYFYVPYLWLTPPGLEKRLTLKEQIENKCASKDLQPLFQSIAEQVKPFRPLDDADYSAKKVEGWYLNHLWKQTQGSKTAASASRTDGTDNKSSAPSSRDKVPSRRTRDLTQFLQPYAEQQRDSESSDMTRDFSSLTRGSTQARQGEKSIAAAAAFSAQDQQVRAEDQQVSAPSNKSVVSEHGPSQTSTALPSPVVPKLVPSSAERVSTTAPASDDTVEKTRDDIGIRMDPQQQKIRVNYYTECRELLYREACELAEKHVQGYVPTAREIDKLFQMHQRHLEYIGTLKSQGWIALSRDNRGCALSAQGLEETCHGPGKNKGQADCRMIWGSPSSQRSLAEELPVNTSSLSTATASTVWSSTVPPSTSPPPTSFGPPMAMHSSLTSGSTQVQHTATSFHSPMASDASVTSGSTQARQAEKSNAAAAAFSEQDQQVSRVQSVPPTIGYALSSAPWTKSVVSEHGPRQTTLPSPVVPKSVPPSVEYVSTTAAASGDNVEKTRDEMQISRCQEEIQVHETNARESFCSEDQQVSTPSNKSVVSEHGQRQTSTALPSPVVPKLVPSSAERVSTTAAASDGSAPL
eukprot:g82551.t1